MIPIGNIKKRIGKQMNIHLSEEAIAWFKTEYEIDGQVSLRFFVRYGGVGGNIPGFSLGVSFDAPKDPHTSTEQENIHFFIEEADAWYFEGKDLHVTVDQQNDEPLFSYK